VVGELTRFDTSAFAPFAGLRVADYQMSSISASNPALHAQLVRAVDDGVGRLRSRRP
jgi:hypothetical protein